MSDRLKVPMGWAEVRVAEERKLSVLGGRTAQEHEEKARLMVAESPHVTEWLTDRLFPYMPLVQAGILEWPTRDSHGIFFFKKVAA